MLGKHARNHILWDASSHTWDLGYHQPIPDICQFLYEVRTELFQYHAALGYRTCTCTLCSFPRVDTNDGIYHFWKVPRIPGISTASQYVRSMAYPLLGLYLAIEGKEGRD